MKMILARLWKEEEGQDLTEYALLLVLVALAAVAALSPLATAINGVFTNAGTALNIPRNRRCRLAVRPATEDAKPLGISRFPVVSRHFG